MFLNKYMKPSFIIIGGVKCGTSSLYRYINQHPNVLPCKIKEPRIFNSRNVFKTLCKLPWYSLLFPEKEFTGWVEADWIEISKDEQFENSIFKKKKKRGLNYITGEASAETFTHAHTWLIQKILPGVKLIVLLRNPTERFISHYKMNMRFAKEGRKQHQFKSLNNYISEQLGNFKKGNNRNVLAQGIYIAHLNRWLKTFSTDELYILQTTDLAKPVSAQRELNNIFRFLGLSEYDFEGNWQRFNASKIKIDIDDEVNRLNKFYQPYNDALAERFNIYFE